jgi:hypothetical protein
MTCVLGCRGAAWDVEALIQRFPALADVGLDGLAEVTPYLLLSQQTLTLFLCRWTVDQPIPVSVASDLTQPERRALDAALRAWESTELGVRFVRVERARASIDIELVDEPVANAAGLGSGNTIADCGVTGPGLPAAASVSLPAELRFASVQLARRNVSDARGRVRALTPEELTGVALHELGHALGFQGHVSRGASALRSEVDYLRRLGGEVLGGARFSDRAMRALYALPSGTVLGRIRVEAWRTQLVDRLARVAVQNEFVGPFARVGDATARIFWRDRGGKEFGLQVINLAETLHRPQAVVVVPEARARRLLPRSRDLSP